MTAGCFDMRSAVSCAILISSYCLAACQNLVYRPCNLNDYNCIRAVLAANSRCNPAVRRSVSSKYLVEEFRYETPSTKSTNIDRNLIVSNQDKCYVSEFFFDNAKNLAVLGIDCPLLNFESDRTVILHSSLKEDMYYNFHITKSYPLIRLTLNILGAANLDICSTVVFADTTTLPAVDVSPRDQLPSNTPCTAGGRYVQELESLAARGAPLAQIFVNTVLCDFRCVINDTIIDLERKY